MVGLLDCWILAQMRNHPLLAVEVLRQGLPCYHLLSTACADSVSDGQWRNGSVGLNKGFSTKANSQVYFFQACDVIGYSRMGNACLEDHAAQAKELNAL